MGKVYIAGILFYCVTIQLAFWRISDMLQKEYTEKLEDFKETTDRKWFSNLAADQKKRLVVVGLCPIAHWLIGTFFLWIWAFPETADAFVRKAIDKILN